MPDFTDYYEARIIEHSFANTNMPASPATVYIGLHTADPTETGEANELDASTLSYERVAVDTSTGGFSITGSAAQNANTLEFPQATENWGTISHFSVWDGAATTDNALWYSELTDDVGDPTTKIIENGDRFEIPAGDLTATAD